MKSTKAERAALLVAVAGSFVTPFMASSINVALPSIGREFHIDAMLLSWVAAAFILTSSSLLVPLGRLSDIVGRKKIYAQGMIVFAISSAFGACAWSGEVLIACRVGQGVGAAMTFATGMAIITSVFPPERRGQALGITVACVYVSLSVGPFLGGVITEHISWRGIFAVVVPPAAFVVWLVYAMLEGEWAEAKGEEFDWLGSVVYTVSLVSFMYGLSKAPAVESLGFLAAGLIGAGVFVKRESSAAFPVLDLGLFRTNRVFALSCLAALLNYASTFAVTFLMSLYLQDVKGLSAQVAGTVLITQPAFMAALSPLAGRLSDRIEPRIVSSLGMFVTMVGLGLLTRLRADTDLLSVVVNLGVLGFGFALFSSPNMNAIMGSVDRRYYGIASGLTATMRQLGMMFSMGIALVLFAVFIGRVKISPEVQGPFMDAVRAAFGVFAALCLVGIFASLARGRLHTNSNG